MIAIHLIWWIYQQKSSYDEFITMYLPYLTAYKRYGCKRGTLILAGPIKKKNKNKNEELISNVINIINIINDNTFNLHNRFLNKDN